MLRNKRLAIALLFAAVIATVFWSQSRVPALNQKAQMGLRTNFGSIAFDTVLPVNAGQPVAERVLRTTVNWGYTNWKGMTFGLLFAAAGLTILGFIKHRSFRQPWLNTLMGMFIGAPLGVCVNCATPIAQGMVAAGARLETALATLISSPMLNAIVLSMAFTLLPWEMALGSLAGVLLLLGTIPFLVRRFAVTADTTLTGMTNGPGFSGIAPPVAVTAALDDESYLSALGATLTGFTRNLFYMLKIAVPLMLLAGFLGALVIELIPFRIFAGFDANLPVLIGTAIFATLLPVPIAFNVIVVMALLAGGMPASLGAVLLFALSVYSIYPASVIARYISVPLSIALGAVVIILATGIGLATDRYFASKLAKERHAIAQGIASGQKKAYREAIGICNKLPGSLQLRCFTDHIGDFGNLVLYNNMCQIRPSAVDHESCRLAVDTFIAKKNAVANFSETPCEKLSDTSAKMQCTLFLAISAAIRNHDISLCNKFAVRNAIQACRIQFLNSSLLFSPDDTVCRNLDRQELSDCKINAAIYRYATTGDLEGCNGLPTPEAREHCRYTVASSMIGKNNDSSGCLELQSSSKQQRCRSLITAWKAQREGSAELCRQLPATDLQNLCLGKIADRQIKAILADYTLGASVVRPLADSRDTETGIDASVPPPSAPPLQWETLATDQKDIIAFTPYQIRSKGGKRAFSRVPAKDLGITRSWDFRMTDFFEPFIMGKGIASGDFNGDFWPDLVLATEKGVVFYQNTGGRFQLLEVSQDELLGKNVFVVALVDADNDGTQDLFASTYGGANYLLLNKNGGFQSPELVRLDGDQRLTLAAGFADLDRSGTLDIVLGNWSSGVEKLFSPEKSTNRILFRQGDAYTVRTLKEIKGETLTVLLADINNDHFTDLLIGNDRLVPDTYYLGTGNGSFKLITRDQGLLPVTSMFTMSLDTADFNNDLKPDLFSTDMTFARSSKNDYCAALEDMDSRSRCTEVIKSYALFTNGSASECDSLGTPRQRQECFVTFSVKAAKEQKDSRYCKNLVDKESSLYSLCLYLASPEAEDQPVSQQQYIRQVQRNVLLMNNGKQFVDKARQTGIDKSFWSWNAKTADLDNDGWQDIYVGNGFHFGDSFYEIQENILFHNIDGKFFDQVAPQWGLDDPINTPSYTYLDLDLDGDIDIIASGVLAPPRIFVNQQKENNSVTFELHESFGNSDGIGAKITIQYGGKKSLRQRKENKLSGGFMSFDNPVLHFGVGKYRSIDGFTVTWPDGQTTRYEENMPVNRIYRITRTEK